MTSLGANTSRLLQIHVETGEQKLIAEDPQYDLSDLFLHPTTYTLEAIGIERERYDWIVIDPKLKNDFHYLSQYFKTPFSITSRDLTNQHWIVVSQSDQRPSHFYLYRRKTQALEFLFTTQSALENYQLSSMQPIQYQARDGLNLHGYLTLPRGLVPRDLPAILLVHGGPWSRDSWVYNPKSSG